MNVSMAQDEKACRDSLLMVLKTKSFDEVRREIDSIKNVNRQVFLKRQLAIIRQEKRKNYRP